MLIKAVVLDGDKGILHVFRNRIESHPNPVFGSVQTLVLQLDRFSKLIEAIKLGGSSLLVDEKREVKLGVDLLCRIQHERRG